MDFLGIFFIGVALSMDAFAVSVACGISQKKFRAKNALPVAGAFGFFQMLMPILGWAMGSAVYEYISAFSSWVAFAILAAVGGKMIYDSVRGEESIITMPMPLKTLLMLSVATSLDAMAVGVSFSMVECKILPSSALIGLTTFSISLFGIIFGKILGDKAGGKFEILGGLVLIAIGIKILVVG